MDIVQWLPGLTGLAGVAVIGSALITSRTALKTAAETNQTAAASANQTARISLHTTYTPPRIKAVTDFLEAFENGRTTLTSEGVAKTHTAYLTLRVLAFEETSEAKDVRNQASALTNDLRLLVETLPHVAPAEAEKVLDELRRDTHYAECQADEHMPPEGKEPSESVRRGIKHSKALREALDGVWDVIRRTDEGHDIPDEEWAYLDHLAAEIGVPNLMKAVETAGTRATRREARLRHAAAERRVVKGGEDFTEAVGRWLNAGPR
ncbi:hypothetical protein [Streptomyces sp. NPDC049949]|uniref:hypothetical protein n=1 Tax=Streptomyces sp. NPDC049949 TaxID=3154627 RepID=UPI00343EF8D8